MLFKDVTQTKDVTEAIMSSYREFPKSQFLRTSSKMSIEEDESEVNAEPHSIAALLWAEKAV